MRFVFIFGVLLILCAALLSAETIPGEFASLTIDGTLTNPLEIRPAGRNPSISSLTANISWFPFARSGQEVLFFATIPTAVVDDSTLVFSEMKPDLGHHSFDIEYRVRTTVDTVKVSDEVSFPLTKLSGDLVPFVQATETIDVTPEIRSLAAELAQGEDDLFNLVVNVGAWTKEHIEYDLSSVNVEASQPSSFVLETRAGVCDELTNLFISLLRSLGVPARFVSGIAFTSSELFDEDWGAHGWAEVYFPGAGWVPFDVTYGQFGWVDASHIVFAVDVDSGEYASSYSWLGHDVDVDVGGMQIVASIVREGLLIDPLLDIWVHPLEEDVGIGSYQLILAEVENPTNFYVADTVQLALVDGCVLLDPSERSVVLAPGETIGLSWRVLVDDDLNDRYVYTYPLVVGSHRGAIGQSEFFVKPKERLLSSSWVNRYAADLIGGVASPYDDDFIFSCNVTQAVVPRVDERVAIRCSLQNTGELDLNGVRVCLENDCVTVDVPAAATEFAVFERVFTDASLYALSFVAENDLVEKHAYVSVEIVQPPNVSIVNVSAPVTLDFSDEGIIRFSVVRGDGATPSDVEISLRGPHVTNSWSFPDLLGVNHFEVTVTGDALSLHDDSFSILVTYSDERGHRVTVEESFALALGEVTWWQRLFLWVSDLF